ncbi:hypothetical protein HZC21_05690, partial [Candidatus Peregrinibacteria bacterium]|nr:hypothetical protein [Candidatus Peregrinibacteria bacterium]
MQKKILSPSDGGDGQQTEVLPDKGSNSAVVGDAEISSRAAAVLAIDDRSPWATALLDEGLFSVEQTVCIDGKNFLLGPVLKNNRLHIVALVDSGDGRFIPSLFYKSLSQGSWRCSPYIEAMVSRGKKSHDYSKGEEAGRFSYTQTTRVTRQLALVLDTQEQKGNYRKIQGSDLDKYFHEDNFDNLFNDSDFKFNKVLTFAEETSAFDFQEHGFDEDPFGYCREIDRLVRKKRKKARQKDGYEDEEKKYASLLFKYRDDKKRLEEIVMEALTDDPAALIQYYNVYRDESYAGKILEKAIKEAAAIDPKSAITTFHLYKDQPYARKMLKRAIKVVIYTDPELVFTCYEDYAEEL